MGAANKLQPEYLRASDLYETVNDPISRIMRKECRKRGIKHLRVVYSCEQPVPVPVREGAPRSERSNLGTASYMPPMMGQMIAAETLRAIAHVGNSPTNWEYRLYSKIFRAVASGLFAPFVL